MDHSLVPTRIPESAARSGSPWCRAAAPAEPAHRVMDGREDGARLV